MSKLSDWYFILTHLPIGYLKMLCGDLKVIYFTLLPIRLVFLSPTARIPTGYVISYWMNFFHPPELSKLLNLYSTHHNMVRDRGFM